MKLSIRQMVADGCDEVGVVYCLALVVQYVLYINSKICNEGEVSVKPLRTNRNAHVE